MYTIQAISECTYTNTPTEETSQNFAVLVLITYVTASFLVAHGQSFHQKFVEGKRGNLGTNWSMKHWVKVNDKGAFAPSLKEYLE